MSDNLPPLPSRKPTPQSQPSEGFNILDWFSGIGGRLSQSLDTAYDFYEASVLEQLIGNQKEAEAGRIEDYYDGFTGDYTPSTLNTPSGGGIDNKTLIIGGIIVVGALLLAKS